MAAIVAGGGGKAADTLVIPKLVYQINAYRFLAYKTSDGTWHNDTSSSAQNTIKTLTDIELDSEAPIFFGWAGSPHIPVYINNYISIPIISGTETSNVSFGITAMYPKGIATELPWSDLYTGSKNLFAWCGCSTATTRPAEYNANNLVTAGSSANYRLFSNQRYCAAISGGDIQFNFTNYSIDNTFITYGNYPIVIFKRND